MVHGGCFGGGEGGLLSTGRWSMVAVLVGVREVCCLQVGGPCWLSGLELGRVCCLQLRGHC